MDPGLLYLIGAFAVVWLVLAGYMLQLRRRAETARQRLEGNDTDAAASAPREPVDARP
ncbi:MAG: CcmD family protein [Candidatus Dormibacteraeota bacterium]|nr:CcmD family protein [Candidatus Dormibacteraeota bacterium]